LCLPNNYIEAVIVERADIAALRTCEERGMFPTEGELARVESTMDDYRRRLRRLSAAGVIRSFHAILVVPPLLGGAWVWAGVLATVARPDKLGPNLAMLFYSRDFDTEARFIRSAAGMEHHEVYRVAEYSFPMVQPLSSDEKRLLRQLVGNPAADIGVLGAELGQTPDWVQVKLDRLLWTPSNRSGVIRIQPEVDWTRVENFGHFHFLLLTGHQPGQLQRLVEERGFELVMRGKTYRERFVQVEADVWGVADLMERVAYLNQIASIKVAGVTWNERVTVNSDWVPGLLES
jgi:DNA-binding Lrp family transcriptional regulator